MRNIIPEDVIKSLQFIDDSENFEIIGLIVLSTKLHEEMHRRFPITCNRDYSAFKTLIFVPLFRYPL